LVARSKDRRVLFVTSASEVAARLVAERVAPCAAAACAIRRGEGFRTDLGGEPGTLFDLASLTKPMTAVAFMRSGLSLATRLAAVLPELSATASADAPFELLLSHRAGLRAHVPLYLPLVTGGTVDLGSALRAAAGARREECMGEIPEDGFPPLYSDLGYILAGVALARHLGTLDAGEAIERLVVTPLECATELGTARGLERTGVSVVPRAAPTEDVAWRGGIVRGRVHDENAWALTGEGGSGHAGMFGTVGAVLTFGIAVLDGLAGKGPLRDARIDELVRERPGGSLRAGFDGKSEVGSAAGESFGNKTFGHLGFTGTSLFLDPEAEVVVALLTNRVHPTREHIAIRAARPLLHDALFRRAREL
jgi:serine-type D-Ala-D-Ala carboxypeptidase